MKTLIQGDLVRALNDALGRGEVYSAVVGVVEGGRREIHGFGRLSRENPSTPDGQSVYELGSIGKVFTALLVERTVQDGRMSWSDTLGERWSHLQLASSRLAAITLRELATHSSGLPTLPDNFEPAAEGDPVAHYQRPHLERFLRNYRPEQLEKIYEYSNLGYGLLGEMAGDAWDLRYADAVFAEVCKPLDLHETSVERGGARASRLAMGTSMGEPTPAWGGYDALAGSGALLSNAEDMLSFIELNLEPTGPCSELLRAAQEPQEQVQGRMGLGWHLEPLDGAESAADDTAARGGEQDIVLWHNGGTGGFATFLGLRPRSHRGVVILTSSTCYGAVTDWGFGQLIEAKTLAQEQLQPLVGTYELSPDFHLTLTVLDGVLRAQATGQESFPLDALSAHHFVARAHGIEIRFAADRAGSEPARSLVLLQHGEETAAPRRPTG